MHPIIFCLLIGVSSPELAKPQQPQNDLVLDTALLSFGLAATGLGIGAIAWWDTHDIQPFGFKETGFFQRWTDSGGGDKAGHFVAHYIGTLMVVHLYEKLGLPPKDALLLGSSFAFLMGNAVEFIDGFTSHQFEYGDAVMNTLGVAMALLHETVPQVAQTIGFRFGYFPSPRFLEKNESFKPIRLVNDYSGHMLFLDLKLKGLLALINQPASWAKYILTGINWGTSHYRPKPGNASLPRRNLGFHLGVSVCEVIDDLTSNSTLQTLGRGLSYFALPFLNLTVSRDLNSRNWYFGFGVGNRFESAL